MLIGHDLVVRLTDPNLPPSQRRVTLREFARVTGWRPSDELEDPETERIATGHLLVEHGLENTVAITFLRTTHRFEELSRADQLLLLSISYNNLVDWHCFPDNAGIWVVYNRTRPLTPEYISLSKRPNAWRAEEFDKLIGRRPSPNLPALDEALIKTVSDWKRVLSGALGREDITDPISELFNAIFFVRALEDDRRKKSPNADRVLLLELEKDAAGTKRMIREIFAAALARLNVNPPTLPADLLDASKLEVFDSLDLDTTSDLFSNFYDNKFAPYHYDFSLISKHALSRIYEHYITALKQRVVIQRHLFGELPDEAPPLTVGAIYTPQYIARFFARFLEDNHTPPQFRALKVADPACGSGMFLRTLLEMQCDPLRNTDVRAAAHGAFANVLGIDVESNACKAARLSLSLLHLVLTGAFPTALKIENDEAIHYLQTHPDQRGTFDAVIANPPYVKWENIPEDWQPRVVELMAGYNAPKPDLYLAFIKVGLELLKPCGFMLYVLPHTFLLARNAERMREDLSRTCWVRFLADLSEINVFEETSSYPILLVVQKKGPAQLPEPTATVVRCTAYPGHALQEALEGLSADKPYYSIYSASQSSFKPASWRVLDPKETLLQEQIYRFPTLGSTLVAKRGFITGKDKVFIRERAAIPAGEDAAYVPYLSDREMQKYRVPVETTHVAFYPYHDGQLMEEADVRRLFPATWAYLKSHAEELKARRSLYRIGEERWWRPLWPRPPQTMLRPKIVSPHLVLFPRFALDIDGGYGVSHAPFLYPKDDPDELDVLRYYLAILNSSVGHWQIIVQSHKYRRGYAMLEPNTLRSFCAPSPASVPPTKMQAIQSLVSRLIENPADRSAEEELDRLVCDLYGVDMGRLKDLSPSIGEEDE